MSKSPKVLWVEDNDTWLELKAAQIEEDLKKHEIEFDYYALEDGEFLEDNFKYYPDFNIAAVDYGLKGLDGVGVIKKILAYKQGCKIVLYSFDDSLDLRAKLMTELNANEKLLDIYTYSTKDELKEVIVDLSKLL